MIEDEQPEQPETPEYTIPESIKHAIDTTIMKPIAGDGTEANPLTLEVSDKVKVSDLKAMFDKLEGYVIEVTVKSTRSNVLEYNVKLTKGLDVQFLTFSVDRTNTEIINYLNSLIADNGNSGNNGNT